MRLGIRLLDSSATLNRFKRVEQLKILSGEDQRVYFQLVDEEQQETTSQTQFFNWSSRSTALVGLRYIPPAGSLVTALLPRQPEGFANLSTNQRDIIDHTISSPAAQAFPEDGSIWYFPLTAAQTQNVTSTTMIVTLTEPGPLVRKAIMLEALSITRPITS